MLNTTRGFNQYFLRTERTRERYAKEENRHLLREGEENRHLLRKRRKPWTKIKKSEKVERNLVQDCLSGETNGEKSRRVQDQHPGQGSLSGEFDVDGKVPDEKQDLDNKVLSGEFKWMRRKHKTDPGDGADSITDSSTDDNSRNSGIDTYSDRNSSSGSELSELAIHTLLVETRARMVELMNPGRIPNVTILVGTNNISSSSDEEEALWESMMVCLFTTLWQKFNCAVLTVCTMLMITRTLTAAGRRHNEGVIRWNNIPKNLASRNAGKMILMDIEHELRAMDQARMTTDGIHFNSIEGQAWLNRVFQERLDELEVELFDTGVLKEEEASNEPTITTFVPPNLETRLGAVPAVTIYKPQSSSEPGHRTDVRDRLGVAPLRRTINPRRRLGPVNSTAETTSTSRSDTRSETTSTSRKERRPSRSSLMWSRPIPSPWHIYKDDLMKLNLQTVSFAADAMRTLNGARLSVSGLYSIFGVDWLIAAGINFNSTTALRFADLE